MARGLIEGRLPPNSPDAERALLGAALIDADVIDLVRLDPADFYREQHQLVWTAILEVSRRREPPDVVTVADELERSGQLDNIGGRSALAMLSNDTPTSIHAEAYAEIIRQKALSRRLIHAAGEVAQVGYDDLGDPEEARDRAEAALYAASRFHGERKMSPIGPQLNTALDALVELNTTRRLPGLDTGLRVLNTMTGGLQKSDLIILAARPSIGKTSLALNIAEHVSTRRETGVGFFSLEMSQEQLMVRLISSVTGIDGHLLRQTGLTEADVQQNGDALDELAHARLFVDDTPNVSVSEIRTKARRLQSETNLGLVVVDYLQLMRSTPAKDGNRVQEVSEISRGLKGLARELSVPVLALSQLSRGVEGRESPEPRLSDLRDSGSIEQDADVVVFLWREKQTEGVLSDFVQFKIAKHRNGPIGESELRFDRRLTRFVDA